MVNAEVPDERLCRTSFHHQAEGFGFYGREGFNALVPYGTALGHGSPLAVHSCFYPVGTDSFAAANVFLNLTVVYGLCLAERERYFLLAGG